MMRVSELQLGKLIGRREVAPYATRKRPKTLTRLSNAEEAFALQCVGMRLPTVTREHLFAKVQCQRLWRFDFCWPEFMVAVEIEGLVCKYINGIPYAIGRHATFTGFEGDCKKYAAAAILGWSVLRFNQALVTDGTAIDHAMDMLKAKGWKQ